MTISLAVKITWVFDHSSSIPLRLRAQEIARPERQHVIPSIDAPTLFVTYCAVCPGQAAEGNGPDVLRFTQPVLIEDFNISRVFRSNNLTTKNGCSLNPSKVTATKHD
jgi:hypothetical protein